MRTVIVILGFLLSFGCSHQSTPTGGGPDPGTSIREPARRRR